MWTDDRDVANRGTDGGLLDPGVAGTEAGSGAGGVNRVVKV